MRRHRDLIVGGRIKAEGTKAPRAPGLKHKTLWISEEKREQNWAASAAMKVSGNGRIQSLPSATPPAAPFPVAPLLGFWIPRWLGKAHASCRAATCMVMAITVTTQVRSARVEDSCGSGHPGASKKGRSGR